MSATPDDSAGFRARFALESLNDGGVLVDLVSGTYFELNVVATETCQVLFDFDDRDAAALHLGNRLGVDRAQAKDLVDSVLADLTNEQVTRDELIGPFRYLRRDDVYVLEDDGRPVVQVDPDDQKISLCVAATSLRYPVLEYLRAVTPKLLGLSGVTVLHASACRWSGRAVGFSGPSGAGKTTTMRAFVAAGAVAISEDLVVLASDQAAPTCYLAGEARAHAWANEAAASLATGASSMISFSSLVDVATGATQTIDEVWFVGSSRRSGDELVSSRLGQSSGLLALLRNTFLGVGDASAWARHLRTIRRLADSLGLLEATVPRGLELLEESARRYVTNSAS
jgi:hypothetical protein